MAKHAMFRADNMAGTTLGQFLVSLRVASDIDNGLLVAIGSLEAGEREVKSIAAITAETKLGSIAVLGSEEVDKEKKIDVIGDFTNKAGSIARGYVLCHGGVYSVTAEAFEGTAPEKNAKVFAKASSNKMATAGDVEIGVCEAIEKDGATTWYVIRIA